MRESSFIVATLWFQGNCLSRAMALPNLPFPVSELGWDKFDEVQSAANLSREECITVMKLVCGDPPPGLETRSIV